jgi:hypothetical protein
MRRYSVELFPLYDPTGPRSVAIHESGHAVSAVVLGLKLNFVEVAQHMRPDTRFRLGVTEIFPEDWDHKDEEAALLRMTQGYAGPAAERKFNYKYLEHNGGESDFEKVKWMAIIAVCKLSKGRYDETIPAEYAHAPCRDRRPGRRPGDATPPGGRSPSPAGSVLAGLPQAVTGGGTATTFGGETKSRSGPTTRAGRCRAKPRY